jgi:hypothetical protein
MKKVLLIGLILAICILAFPQGVLAADDSATVNANIATSLDFTAAGPVGTWDLQPSGDTTTASNADGITFFVNSNGAWGVHPKLTSSPPQTGIMAPAVPESGASALGSMLQVERITDGNFQYVSESTDILKGLATPPTGVTLYRALRQTTALTDHRLMTTHYTAEVTFECIQNA